MLIDIAAFVQIGGLDEEYGFYWEDVDFGLRCARQGFKVGLCPDWHVAHAVSSTAGRYASWKRYMLTRNRLFCCRKHRGVAASIGLGIRQTARAAMRALSRRGDILARASLWGAWHGMFGKGIEWNSPVEDICAPWSVRQ